MKRTYPLRQIDGFHYLRRTSDGSVLVVTMITVMILLLALGTVLLSMTNKYFTAYQWASWQEALQGAESGADIAMAEMKKDATKFGSSPVPWVGWRVGTYKTVNGQKLKDPTSEKTVDSDGTFANNSGGGGGNTTPATLYNLRTHVFDYMTYGYDPNARPNDTQLTAHVGEGNNNLKIGVTVDAPTSLNDAAVGQWVRVRASGTTDVVGPARVSEEQRDNRLRKLSINLIDAITGLKRKSFTTRRIELVARPVSLFSGALSAMVQIKNDDQGMLTDSFNSEDAVHWPQIPDPNNPGTTMFDMSVSHDPTTSLGKNGDVASNGFPVKHDKSETMDLKHATIWGDVGNNYSQIKGLDPAYYGGTPDDTNFGLNNNNYGTINPTPTLIKTNGDSDVSGNISTNYYRDLPPVTDPQSPTSPGQTWTSSDINYNYTKVDKDTPDITTSSNPNQPTRIKVSGNLSLANKDKWTLKAPAVASGWTTSTPPVVGYVEIWVTGDIKLDDGGTVVIQQVVDGATGVEKSHVEAKIYFDHNVKVGETKENKTNGGGFDNQTDDAKSLLLFGVTQPDAGKMPHDEYIDPLGNDALYTPYKASGNIVFKESDFTGAIYAPDHNIVFDASHDGRGKRKKRKQDGNDFYGAYVGRTINNKKLHNFHFDESLNDFGPVRDWGYTNWFEDVDVDHRQSWLSN